jgi:ribosome-binding protein aMBF1 (putative translation factor)
MAGTSDAVDILAMHMKDVPNLQQMLAEERERSTAACVIYNARTAAGLTQQQLADLVGTTQSVISRLEDADYEGHTFHMLQRIAAALSQNRV